jgi:uncharacterized SAM-binding protein YcdF (DUF218 family)
LRREPDGLVKRADHEIDVTMYFYLSKTLGDVAIPSVFIMLVIVSGPLLWLSRFARLGRRMTVVGVMLLLIAGVTPLGTALLIPLENRFPPWRETQGPPAGIIVLGGVINTYLSSMRNEVSLGGAANRMVAAVELYRRYPQARILFAGGNANVIFKGRSESRFAVRLFEDLGVPDDHIFVDSVSRNTEENAANAKKIADPKPGERWLLVTSAVHMPRAIGLFRAVGFPVEPYPVDWRTGGWGDLAALPKLSLGGFNRLDPAVHEWEGLFYDWMTGRTKTLFPAPADSTADESGGLARDRGRSLIPASTDAANTIQ